MMLADGQMFQPFDAAFNGVNISHVRVKGRIRQTVCGSFRSNRLDSSSYRQLRSKEVSFKRIDIHSIIVFCVLF